MDSSTSNRVLEDLPWARGFARTCAAKLPSHLDRDDLQSAGVLGYLRAANRFDISRGTSFRGYCAVRIRGAVLDELRKWDWTPRSVHKNQRRITSVTGILIEQLGRDPTPEEIASALGVHPTELAEMQSFSQPRQVVSFDESSENSYGEEGLTLVERLADNTIPTPDAAAFQVEDRRTLLKCLAILSKQQATVVILHYLQNAPLREVAARLKVTSSRVSQLHHQALLRLRQSWKRMEEGPRKSPP